jgi:hypothetical protein
MNGGTFIDWTGGLTPGGTESQFGVSFSRNESTPVDTPNMVLYRDVTAGRDIYRPPFLIQKWDPTLMTMIDVIPGNGDPGYMPGNYACCTVQRRVTTTSGDLNFADLFRDGPLWNAAQVIDPSFVYVALPIRALLYSFPLPSPGQWDVMMYDVHNENGTLVLTYGNAITATSSK